MRVSELNYFSIGMIFIILKVTGAWDIDWQWVLSPFWIEAIMYLVFWFVDTIMLSLANSIIITKLPPDIREKFTKEMEKK